MLRFMCAVALSLFCFVASAQDPFPVRTVLAGEVAVVPAGDYVLSKQVAVKSGGKLIIESGVKIRVQIGLPISVYGELDIRGTSTDPVVIVPDVVGACGTIAAFPIAGAPRPKFTASFLQLTHNKDSNSIFLSGCDFMLSNSIVSNLSPSANRACVAVANGASGLISGCFLDGCKDRIKTSVTGVTVDKDEQSRLEIDGSVIANGDLIRSAKPFTSVSALIE